MEPSNIDLNQLEKEGYEIGGREPETKDYFKERSGIQNLPAKYEYDPIEERERKFTQLIDIEDKINALIDTKKNLKESFRLELESLEEELEGEGNPIIRSETKRGVKISLRRDLIREYPEAIKKAEERLKNLKDSIKERKAKAIRLGKTEVIDQKTTIVFSSK